ncbi:FliM/FliN family flagellar motor switch protein [Pseudomonas baetica]|uniref:FliM/FliN family flagellar motor switch protein n=1 Tax=Pseudomonas baetica TaxID=674054 RepID=UPI003EF07C26
MSVLKLRRVDTQAHAVAQWVQRWQRTGHGAGLGRPDRQPGYLRFRAQGDGGDWLGLIVAHDWLSHALPALQSLLTVECSLASIAGLFQAVQRPLLLEVEGLHDRALSDIECLVPTQLPAHDLPWLDTPRGRVWLMRLPSTPITAGCPVSADSWLRDLPLRLTLMLGISQLSPASRRRLSEGDVLRIMQRTQHCWLANRCLGVFTFTEGGLHMETTVADTNEQNAPGPDLGAVPVHLEFVLATHETDLATLLQIIDGQLIPLADDAVRHIEVRANGKRVARGELVQLDEQFGVELLEIYRNTCDE